jgi:hypothetical protein
MKTKNKIYVTDTDFQSVMKDLKENKIKYYPATRIVVQRYPRMCEYVVTFEEETMLTYFLLKYKCRVAE